MENVDFGILCLIPPIITIILALVTKNTILSLFLGVWVGATIIAGWNPLSGFINVFNDFMIPSLGNGIILLVTLAGGMIIMLRVVNGSAYAFAKLLSKKIEHSGKGTDPHQRFSHRILLHRTLPDPWYYHASCNRCSKNLESKIIL